MGQTLANLAMTAGRLDASGVWDLEDHEALEAANTLIEQESEALALVLKQANPVRETLLIESQKRNPSVICGV
jgi:hypothetical protein